MGASASVFLLNAAVISAHAPNEAARAKGNSSKWFEALAKCSQNGSESQHLGQERPSRQAASDRCSRAFA